MILYKIRMYTMMTRCAMTHLEVLSTMLSAFQNTVLFMKSRLRLVLDQNPSF